MANGTLGTKSVRGEHEKNDGSGDFIAGVIGMYDADPTTCEPD